MFIFFIESYQGLHGLREPARLGPWLRTAAINRSIDRLRRRRKSVGLDAVAADLKTERTPEDEFELGDASLQKADPTDMARVRVVLEWQQNLDGEQFLYLKEIKADSWYAESVADQLEKAKDADGAAPDVIDAEAVPAVVEPDEAE